MPRSEHETASLAREIERYLSEHPLAADSLEGITKWWLARQRYEEAYVLVQAALDHLIASGRICRTYNSDGRQIFKAKEQTL